MGIFGCNKTYSTPTELQYHLCDCHLQDNTIILQAVTFRGGGKGWGGWVAIGKDLNKHL